MKSNRAVAIAAMLFRLFLLLSLAAASARAGEIHDAAAAGDLNKVRALVQADPTLLESIGNEGFTPLISACSATQVAVANYLIDQGANIKAKNNWSGTPLYCAIRNPELIQRLIDKGADVNARAFGANGLTPLQQAASIGELKTAKLLIDHGADLNGRSSDGTVLQNVIKRKGDANREMVKLLLEGGAKLQEFSFGNTELHLAALNGSADIARLLVEHGVDINAANDYQHTPVFYAARHGFRRVADGLIALGANPKDIVEENYAKAPQLNAALQPGEAYLWFLGGLSPGTGYAVKTKEHLLVFDPYTVDESPEAGLANGRLNPQELAGQKITVLITRSAHGAPSGSELAKRFPDADFVLGFKPTDGNGSAGAMPPYRLAAPHESFSLGDIQVHTVRATGRHYIEGVKGVGYLVEVDGLKIYHAGLHASSRDAAEQAGYREEVDFLKPFGPVDIAILPIRGRHISIAYEPYLYLLDQLSPKAVYLIGDDLVTEEHKKCVEVLRARNIPVAYPEGGIAIGERFHFVRDQASTASLQKTDVPPFSGAYLGQPPPGDNPQVFARGIVSDNYQQHGAPAFSPDGNEVFWQTNRLDREKKWLVSVMTSRRVGDSWTPPEVSPYGSGPVFSPDGKRLYLGGKGKGDDPSFVEKQGNSWSEPKRVGLLARYPELQHAYFPSIARNGTLYFMGYAEGFGLNIGIYRAELVNGEYAKPELLPPSINAPGGILNWTPFIAPDESYLIFCSRQLTPKDDYGDLYLCFRQPDGTWTDRFSLGEPINSKGLERFPVVSPDGKYLFFTRDTPGYDEDVYWVSAGIIEKLKAKAIQELRLRTDHRQEKPK